MYLGDSRARWEGEELVVETTNLTDQTAFGVNGNGTRHSKAMKITERFRRVADDIIQYQATWDDPLTYEAPFTVSFPLTPLDGGVLLPYDCHPGNTAISMSLSAERAGGPPRWPRISRRASSVQRRAVQECGAGVGCGAGGRVRRRAGGCRRAAAAVGAAARRTPAIYTDGRKALVDPKPSWLGYSIGSWQGDTFVIETAASTTRRGSMPSATRAARPCGSPNVSGGATLATWTWSDDRRLPGIPDRFRFAIR